MFAFYGCLSTKDGVNIISVKEVKELIDSGNEEVFLLDVRTLEEYYGEYGHLLGAVLIPHDQLPLRLAELEEHKDKKIVAYCRTGRRSEVAAKILKENGFDVYNMSGGMHSFKQAYPNY